MNSFKTFSDYKLRDRCEFLSSLKDEYISEKDYLHSIDVWIMFKMNTMGDYHDLYLKTNVLLLADVFEKFIDMCLEYYGLDLCHYFSSPGLSWYAKLKMAKIELELVSDISLFLFNEKGMGRGISYIAKKYSQVNNILYGWAMDQYLPYSKFKWLNKKEIDKFDVKAINKNNSPGYILEFDLEYPDELHELHNDYSLAPAKLGISHDMLSKYYSSIANKYDIKNGGVNKLFPNLGNKSKYVLYYKSL